MTHLEAVEITFKKYGVKYHKMVEGEITTIQPFKDRDIEGHIYVNGYGLVKLIKSEQLIDYMEFNGGKLASY